MSSGGKATFLGGIHPPSDCKQYSRDCPIEAAPLPQQVVLPLDQHIGVPAQAVAGVGHRVKKGQLVAEAAGFVSAHIHAPVSGTVSAVEPRPSPLGGRPPAIVIDSDGLDEWASSPPKQPNASELTAEQIRERVRAAGIVGLGGASFPTHVKLSPPEGKRVDSVVINGAECEPYLTSDFRIMLERSRDVVDGARLVMAAVGATKGYIGIEDNKPEATAAMRAACDGRADVEVVQLETKYPQGQEHQIIWAILGREVPSGGLPMDIGVNVQNVSTAVAIYEAVRLGRPLIERGVTISGDGIERPGNILVRVGSSIGQLLEWRGVRERVSRLLLGGPMMGLAQYTFELPVLKSTSGVVVMCDSTLYESHQCIRCGECVAHCPMRLVPSYLSQICEARDMEGIAKSDIMDCKLCGCCSYVCPARRPIVHQVRFGQAELRKSKVIRKK